MALVYQNLYVDQNTNYTTNITLSGGFGVPFNLVGYTLEAQFKQSYISANISGAFIANTINANSGIISLSLLPANTSSIRYGKYYYDVLAKSPANTYLKVVEGMLYLNPTASTPGF